MKPTHCLKSNYESSSLARHGSSPSSGTSSYLSSSRERDMCWVCQSMTVLGATFFPPNDQDEKQTTERETKSKRRRKREDKYKGVRQRPWGRWIGHIRDPRRAARVWLGTFEMAGEAAKAFDRAPISFQGARTNINFQFSQYA